MRQLSAGTSGRFNYVFLAFALASACLAGAGEAPFRPNTPMQTPKQFQVSKTQKIQVNYLLFLPKGYEAAKNPQSRRWPLILFLHGAGERGTDIWKVAVHGPPKNVATHPDFPFIVVSPQCPDGQIWSKETLLALLDEVIEKYAVDKQRVYLTGLSMGGYGTWDLGLSGPERFAAMAPICGGGELITLLLSSGQKSTALKSLGIWAFHGAKDPVVPLHESERMIDFVKKAGASEARLTVYPEATHDAWTETYNNPELYEWFLKHRREAP